MATLGRVLVAGGQRLPDIRQVQHASALHLVSGSGTAGLLNEDFLDMLRALVEEGVDFMIVGAYALAAHDIPRATGDFDIWIRPTWANAGRALLERNADRGASGYDS